MRNWPAEGIGYGADYNPEQWPEQTWVEDVALMRGAGVNLVSVGIFSWALLEPAPGAYDFGWLDRVLDLLHDGGIARRPGHRHRQPAAVAGRRHPETLPRRPRRHTLWPGGRQAYCPSSPVFRERALALASRAGQRYADHPAVVMWHVSNELGCHNVHCYCDVSAEAFRGWLRERYGDLDALNDAWGTAFWSQRYGDWAEVIPPRRARPSPTPPSSSTSCASPPTSCAPTTAPSARSCAALPRPGHHQLHDRHLVKHLDYHSWAAELDVVANDHYLTAADPRRTHRAWRSRRRPHPGVAGGARGC